MRVVAQDVCLALHGVAFAGGVPRWRDDGEVDCNGATVDERSWGSRRVSAGWCAVAGGVVRAGNVRCGWLHDVRLAPHGVVFGGCAAVARTTVRQVATARRGGRGAGGRRGVSRRGGLRWGWRIGRV